MTDRLTELDWLFYRYDQARRAYDESLSFDDESHIRYEARMVEAKDIIHDTMDFTTFRRLVDLAVTVDEFFYGDAPSTEAERHTAIAKMLAALDRLEEEDR